MTCEHGTAMDVHCCNCHSGFIFDSRHECPTLGVEDQSEDSDMVNAMTAIVREADDRFQKSGGTSRHWVCDWFLPILNGRGWRMVPAPPAGPEGAKS